MFHNPQQQTVNFHFSMSLGPLGPHSRRHEDRKNNQGVSGLQHQHTDSGQPAKRGCWRNNARQPVTENQPQAICGMSYCWQLNCCLNVKIIKKVYFPCLILMFIPVTSICVRAEWFQQSFCRLVLQTQLKCFLMERCKARFLHWFSVWFHKICVYIYYNFRLIKSLSHLLDLLYHETCTLTPLRQYSVRHLLPDVTQCWTAGGAWPR